MQFCIVLGGDTTKGAISALPWLRRDLANASGGAPVVIFQHYGWDSFSVERWDAQNTTFDLAWPWGILDWWSEQDRQALIDTLAGYNVARYLSWARTRYAHDLQSWRVRIVQAESGL